MNNLKSIIEEAWLNRDLLKKISIKEAINTVVNELDLGNLRIAEQKNDQWIINEWIKKAVILYFPIQKMEILELGPFEFHDKIKLKKGYSDLGVRVVPHAIARHGSFLA